MVRTKGNHANFRTPSPSPSPPRSPSPLSRPSSPANPPPASPDSSDYQTPTEATPHSSPQIEPNPKPPSNPNTLEEPSSLPKHTPTEPSLPEMILPLNFLFPPLFQATIPNLNQTPPHLKTKPRKATSAPNLALRRSHRLMSSKGTKKTNEVDNTVHEISDDDDVVQKEIAQQPNPIPIPEKITPVTTNEETIAPPIEKESESLPNPSDSVEITPQQTAAEIAPEKPPSPIAIPREASPTISDKEKEKTQEVSPEISLARRKGKRKVSEKSERSSVKEVSFNKRVKSRNLSVSKSKFPLLIDPSLNKTFYEKWSSRPIGVGRFYDFDKLERDEIFIKQYPDKLGWVPFLQIRERHYPEAIQAFYLMAECYPEKDLIVSTIKDVKIRISLEEISTILKIPISGPTIYGDDWYDVLGLDYEIVCKTIFKPDAPGHTYSSLLPITKILTNMCHYSFLPKNGSYDQISHNDILLIYHMFIGEPLNLPHIIIQNMMLAAKNPSKKGTLPYGMTLSKILKKLDVPLDDELSSFKFSTFGLKNVHQMKDEPEIHIPPAENVSQS